MSNQRNNPDWWPAFPATSDFREKPRHGGIRVRGKCLEDLAQPCALDRSESAQTQSEPHALDSLCDAVQVLWDERKDAADNGPGIKNQ